jgi:SAM-dependent methyltransferase
VPASTAVAAGERWADIGAGSGAFTLALADLLGPGATVVALDRDAKGARDQCAGDGRTLLQCRLETRVCDLIDPPDLGLLDGIVAANSLHYVPRDRQVEVVRRLAALIRPGGRFVVVEYDADRGNPWGAASVQLRDVAAPGGRGGSPRYRPNRPGPEPFSWSDLRGGQPDVGRPPAVRQAVRWSAVDEDLGSPEPGGSQRTSRSPMTCHVTVVPFPWPSG